jgi:hypothetical protein
VVPVGGELSQSGQRVQGKANTSKSYGQIRAMLRGKNQIKSNQIKIRESKERKKANKSGWGCGAVRNRLASAVDEKKHEESV